jgi:ribose transport system permease protein
MAVPIATTTLRSRRRSWAARNSRVLLAYLAMALLIGTYVVMLPTFGVAQAESIVNQGMTRTIAGLAQTLVVLTGGVDLSVGPLIALTNSIASALMSDNPLVTALVIVLVLGIGALCGFLNGALVAYGRLQPIVVTLATASIFTGCALFIRPQPGGYVPLWFSTALTRSVGGVLPSGLILIGALVVGWLLFRRTRLATQIYAVGSSEGASYMSGISVVRAKLAAYTLAGLASAVAGLFFTAHTASGDALAGSVFTLDSVAAVVLGGTSLMGGRGGFIGTIAGAYVVAVIISVLFFFDIPQPQFYQSVFQGGILLVAVALGSLGILRVKNRLDTL